MGRYGNKPEDWEMPQDVWVGQCSQWFAAWGMGGKDGISNGGISAVSFMMIRVTYQVVHRMR